MSVKAFFVFAVGAIAFTCIAVPETEAQFYRPYYYMPYYRVPSYGFHDEFDYYGHALEHKEQQNIPEVKAPTEVEIPEKEPTVRSVMKVWAPWTYAVALAGRRGPGNVHSKKLG